MKKEVKTSGGLEVLPEALHRGKTVQLSEKMIDKLSIINFYETEWDANEQLPNEDKLSKRAIIDKAYQIFPVEYATLYRIWVECQDKLGLSAILPKHTLLNYIINKSMTLIDREEASDECDTKAVAQLIKNLKDIYLAMPEEEEDREPLPIPIFVFNPELLANHVNIKKMDIPKILAELRSNEGVELSRPKIKGGIGTEIDYQEVK